MPPYAKLAKLIRQHQIQTITVDIFDTILMRQIWPEDLQFLRVAERQLPLFHKIISPKITAYQLYSWRQYLRDEIIDTYYRYDLKSDSNPDLTLKIWFSALVRQFANLHNVKLSNKAKKDFIQQLINIELDTEKSLLTPNTTLINTLKQLKSTFPHLKIYFLSDMYLTSTQIKDLLEYFKINLFDDGITSTDAGHAKASGTIFYYLSEQRPFGDFDPYHNLHLGDNSHSDYKQPLKSGCFAIQTPTSIHRHLKTLQGKLILGHRHYLATKQDRRHTKQFSHLTTASASAFWQSYGILFSQPLYTFLFHISNAAQHSPNTTFILHSSEAVTFEKLAHQHFAQLFSASNLQIAGKLNRKTMIRALIWAAYQQSADYNAHVITKIASFGELLDNRQEIYQFIFNRPASELALNARANQEFYKAILSDLQHTTPSQRRHLTEAYDYVAQFLPSHNSNDIVMVDVGWGGTVPSLFRQFCRLHGLENRISALYLGVFIDANRFADAPCPLYGYLMPNVRYGSDRSAWNAVMWEYAYTNKVQFPGDTTRLKYINQGINQGASFFTQIQNSPKKYFQKVIRPQLRHLVSSPTRRQVALISEIRFDQGFMVQSSFQIVDTNFSTFSFWLFLLRHPRRAIHDYLFRANCWPMGYISYYRLYPLKLLIRLYEKIKHRHFI